MNEPVEVVAAAIVRGGRVLAARRAAGHRLAGGWEFPGGKVEHGEDDVTALARECVEELGIGIEVGARLDVAGTTEIRLTLYAATIESGEPQPLENHDELRWLAATELDAVAWLPIDLALTASVARLLREHHDER